MQREDMELLKLRCPEGYFTPSFTGARNEALFCKSGMGYYFNFPNDQNGQELLAHLRLRDMWEK
jgi:hypothetical protein